MENGFPTMTMEVINPKRPSPQDFKLTHSLSNIHHHHNNNNNIININEVTEELRTQIHWGNQDLEVINVLEITKEDNNRGKNPLQRPGTPAASPSGVQSRKNVFEKLAALDKDGQRPTTKRQLSVESTTRSFRTVKNTTVRKDKVPALQPKLKLQAGQKSPSANPCVPGTSLRKPRKDLFSSTKVFESVDTHARNTGNELRERRVFSVQSITEAVTLGASSELEKLRAIWVWLCHNIEYDVDGYLGLTEKLCSPERVIEMGRGVCCGFSSVCLQMCREAGIECQEVSGHGKGIGYRLGQSYQNTESNHMWNAVLLGGQWYLLDACWGAGRVDINNRVFIQRFDDFYFLAEPEDFIDSHYPDDEKWQLLETPISLEEFEKRVFKTSEFHRLGLTLRHPKHFLLITENGEATVSVGSSQPMEFTYQITQQRGSESTDVSSSIGLLTVTNQGMALRLLPPAQGTYDVMVFARPADVSGTFNSVCSFVLECPEPRASEELPENPFLTWGLVATASALGLKDSSQGAEVAEVDTGVFQLVLQTCRPLMVLCELSHKDLDAALAKRCLATQIEPNRLTCYVLLPYRGSYRLSVFVRDYEQAGDGFQNAGNFLLRCAGNPINLNELFPLSLSSSCGPGLQTASAGLSKFSHTGALITTQQGKCNITFHNAQDLDLHAELSKAQKNSLGCSLARHVFFTHTDSKVTLSVNLPEAGIYRLGLYGKIATSQDFRPLCDFVLRSHQDSGYPPFPSPYAAWRKGCVLFEPRSGHLAPRSCVCFRVRVPWAHSVCVVGEGRTPLQLNRSRVWEGEVFTGSSVPELKLAARGPGGHTDMAVLMCFDVLSQQNEV